LFTRLKSRDLAFFPGVVNTKTASFSGVVNAKAKSFFWKADLASFSDIALGAKNLASFSDVELARFIYWTQKQRSGFLSQCC
jgi:hypothetical protein